MSRARSITRLIVCTVLATLLSGTLFGATPRKRKRAPARKVHTAKAAHKRAVRPTPAGTRALRRVSLRNTGPVVASATIYGSKTSPVIRGGPWNVPTYADSTAGDNVDGEDIEVRRAAVEALGAYNGAIVVVDAATGRILTMVNQKLALSSGFQPCSTIKVAVSLAALSEKLVTATQKVKIHGAYGLNMTQALAHSNNYYFANLGLRLGYEKVSYYARLFGYGEKAGLSIPGERAGFFPEAAPINGGVGMLTSFGEEIRQTPLQLAALMSAIANGGTLYYLQYPRTQEEARGFIPFVKRQLEIRNLIPEVKPGLLAAVSVGTARRASQDQPIAGKTGTCTESRTHLGWFGAFNDLGDRKLVVVVLLTGGRPSIGPMAASVAGDVYRKLATDQYFAAGTPPFTPASLVSAQVCCAR